MLVETLSRALEGGTSRTRHPTDCGKHTDELTMTLQGVKVTSLQLSNLLLQKQPILHKIKEKKSHRMQM